MDSGRDGPSAQTKTSSGSNPRSIRLREKPLPVKERSRTDLKGRVETLLDERNGNQGRLAVGFPVTEGPGDEKPTGSPSPRRSPKYNRDIRRHEHNDVNSALERPSYHRKTSAPAPRRHEDGHEKQCNCVNCSRQTRTSTDHSASSDLINFSIKPESGQDVTIHAKLEATDDLEEDLEEFSRLKRLGHYKSALQLFQSRLNHFIDNKYILVQYGQCLLELSDINQLRKLAEKFPAKIPCPRSGQNGEEVQWNWSTILARAAVEFNDGPLPSTGSDIGRILSLLQNDTMVMLRQKLPELDSTEIQILCNVLSFVPDSSVNGVDFGEPYAHLKAESRVWEFRDILQALLVRSGLETTLRLFFRNRDGVHYVFNSNYASRTVERIQLDWSTLEDDEATSLALLEIFTALSMSALDRHDDNVTVFRGAQLFGKSVSAHYFDIASVFFGAAKQYATEVFDLDPSNLKSRPYLRWVMAKAHIQQSHGPNCAYLALRKHLSGLKGTVLTTLSIFPFHPILLYMPQEDETPHWQPDATTSNGEDEVIKLVYKSARELGDVQLQAVCLQHMVYQSSDPSEILRELVQLWESVGNRVGLLASNLYAYIPKRSPPATDRLLQTMLGYGEPFWHVSFRNLYFKILGASTPRPHEKAMYLGRLSNFDYTRPRPNYKNIHAEENRHLSSLWPPATLPTSYPPRPSSAPPPPPTRSDSETADDRYETTSSASSNASEPSEQNGLTIDVEEEDERHAKTKLLPNRPGISNEVVKYGIERDVIGEVQATGRPTNPQELPQGKGPKDMSGDSTQWRTEYFGISGNRHVKSDNHDGSGHNGHQATFEDAGKNTRAEAEPAYQNILSHVEKILKERIGETPEELFEPVYESSDLGAIATAPRSEDRINKVLEVTEID